MTSQIDQIDQMDQMDELGELDMLKELDVEDIYDILAENPKYYINEVMDDDLLSKINLIIYRRANKLIIRFKIFPDSPKWIQVGYLSGDHSDEETYNSLRKSIKIELNSKSNAVRLANIKNDPHSYGTFIESDKNLVVSKSKSNKEVEGVSQSNKADMVSKSKSNKTDGNNCVPQSNKIEGASVSKDELFDYYLTKIMIKSIGEELTEEIYVNFRSKLLKGNIDSTILKQLINSSNPLSLLHIYLI